MEKHKIPHFQIYFFADNIYMMIKENKLGILK